MKHPRLCIAFGLGVATAIAACNSLLGLDDLEVDTQSEGGAGSGGTAGNGGDSGPCPASCTKRACTERAQQNASRPDGVSFPQCAGNKPVNASSSSGRVSDRHGRHTRTTTRS